MKRLVLGVSALAAAAFGACGGDGLSLEDALQRMVLQPQDLPQELVRGEESFLTNQDAAAGNADRQAMLERWGRVLGFEVTYEPAGATAGDLPVQGIDVSASVYETDAGAADSFADAAKTAEETDWAANYSGLGDFERDDIEASAPADEIVWLRLSGIRSGPDGDDELVTDDLIFFREGRERGFLRVQAITAETGDRAHYQDTVEGWLAVLVANVEEALAKLGDGG